MGVLVKNPGLFTTVQDEGRFGFQQYGVTPSGPMDIWAFYTANILVGNDIKEGALELTVMGPELLFDEDCVVAITGADMKPVMDGMPAPMYQAFCVKKGSTLKFNFSVNGRCSYLAFSGGLDIPKIMDSKSTLASKGLGGYEGRKLEKGDIIGFSYPSGKLTAMDNRRLPKPVYPKDEVTLRVLPGPQDDNFSPLEFRKFFWYSFNITNDYDRMGCRLERQEPIRHLTDGNIISDGIACGSIQVPPNGQPIIMLADRQSVGGYPKIGTVITTDIGKLGQALPGMKVRFVEVSLDLAQDLYEREMERIESLVHRFQNKQQVF